MYQGGVSEGCLKRRGPKTHGEVTSFFKLGAVFLIKKGLGMAEEVFGKRREKFVLSVGMYESVWEVNSSYVSTRSEREEMVQAVANVFRGATVRLCCNGEMVAEACMYEKV